MAKKILLVLFASLVFSFVLQNTAYADSNDCSSSNTSSGFKCENGGFKASGRDIFGDAVYTGYGEYAFIKMSKSQYTSYLQSKDTSIGWRYQNFESTYEDVCSYAICAASPSLSKYGGNSSKTTSSSITSNPSTITSNSYNSLSNYGKLSPITISRKTSSTRSLCSYFMCLSQYKPKIRTVTTPKKIVTTPKTSTPKTSTPTTTTTLPKDVSAPPTWIDTTIKIENLKYEADCSIASAYVYPPKATDKYGVSRVNMRVSWGELPIYNFNGNMKKAEIYFVPREPQPKLIFKAVDIHGYESSEFIYEIPDECPYKDTEEPDLFVGPINNKGPIATDGPKITGYKRPRPRATVYAKMDCRNCDQMDWIKEYYFVLQSVNGGPENTCESGWRITLATWDVEATCEIQIFGAPSGEYYLTVVGTTESGVVNSTTSRVNLDPSY